MNEFEEYTTNLEGRSQDPFKYTMDEYIIDELREHIINSWEMNIDLTLQDNRQLLKRLPLPDSIEFLKNFDGLALKFQNRDALLQKMDQIKIDLIEKDEKIRKIRTDAIKGHTMNKISTIVDTTADSYTQQKQRQYQQEVVEAIKKNILSGNDKRLEGWTNSSDLVAMNGITGKQYNGLNTIKLITQGYTDNRWLTYEQIKELGGTIKKGEKGQVVEFASFTKKTADGKVEKLKNPIYKQYTLFNVNQAFNIDKDKLFKGELHKQPSPEEIEQRKKRIEKTIENMGIKVAEDTKATTALYDAKTDTISMPKDILSPAAYYGTLLNQAVKATTNPNRLEDRNPNAVIGSKEHAKEILATEISSMMMISEYGVRINANRDAEFEGGHGTNMQVLRNYIKSGVLQDNDIKDATFKALKSQRLILKNTPQKVKQVEKSQEVSKPAQEAVEPAKKPKSKGMER